MVLPNGSCTDCARELHIFEEAVINRHLGLARYALGIQSRKRRGKKKKPRPATYQLTAPDEGTVSVPITKDMPQLIVAGHYNQRAVVLTGVDSSNAKMAATLAHKNVIAPPNGKYGPSVGTPGGTRMDYFTRFVAKIAHCYAAAMMGGAFIPYLIGFIDGKEPESGVKYVGINGKSEGLPNALHRVTLAVESIPTYSLPMLPPTIKQLVVVRLDLFFDYNLPTYEIVVGEAINAPP
jgi:hypothetical protein